MYYLTNFSNLKKKSKLMQTRFWINLWHLNVYQLMILTCLLKSGLLESTSYLQNNTTKFYNFKRFWIHTRSNKKYQRNIFAKTIFFKGTQSHTLNIFQGKYTIDLSDRTLTHQNAAFDFPQRSIQAQTFWQNLGSSCSILLQFGQTVNKR